MRIRYLKNHYPFLKGEEVESENAPFLIRYKIAEEIIEPVEEPEAPKEKLEVKKTKEKRENKTGNVPTAVTMKSIKKAK